MARLSRSTALFAGLRLRLQENPHARIQGENRLHSGDDSSQKGDRRPDSPQNDGGDRGMRCFGWLRRRDGKSVAVAKSREQAEPEPVDPIAELLDLVGEDSRTADASMGPRRSGA